MNGNYSYNNLITNVNDDIVPAFNTPKNKYNIVLTKNTNNIEIVVNNTEGVKTLWTATLKIDKTVLWDKRCTKK